MDNLNNTITLKDGTVLVYKSVKSLGTKTIQGIQRNVIEIIFPGITDESLIQNIVVNPKLLSVFSLHECDSNTVYEHYNYTLIVGKTRNYAEDTLSLTVAELTELDLANAEMKQQILEMQLALAEIGGISNG